MPKKGNRTGQIDAAQAIANAVGKLAASAFKIAKEMDNKTQVRGQKPTQQQRADATHRREKERRLQEKRKKKKAIDELRRPKHQAVRQPKPLDRDTIELKKEVDRLAQAGFQAAKTSLKDSSISKIIKQKFIPKINRLRELVLDVSTSHLQVFNLVKTQRKLQYISNTAHQYNSQAMSTITSKAIRNKISTFFRNLQNRSDSILANCVALLQQNNAGLRHATKHDREKSCRPHAIVPYQQKKTPIDVSGGGGGAKPSSRVVARPEPMSGPKVSAHLALDSRQSLAAHSRLPELQAAVKHLTLLPFASIKQQVSEHTDNSPITCQKMANNVDQIKLLCYQALDSYTTLDDLRNILAQITKAATSFRVEAEADVDNRVIKDKLLTFFQQCQQQTNSILETWGDLFIGTPRKVAREISLIRGLAFNNNITKLAKECAYADTNPLIMAFLDGLKNWLHKNQHYAGSVFISYAWPIDGSGEQKWLQPTLKCIKKSLMQAGIDTYLDIEDPDARKGIHTYMSRKLRKAQFAIIIGTPSLLAKHGSGFSFVQSELAIIYERLAKTHQSLHDFTVIPINLSPDFRHSFPYSFHGFKTIQEWAESDYLINLQRLIGDIYGVSRNRSYQRRWEELIFDLKQAENGHYKLRRSPIDVPRPSTLAHDSSGGGSSGAAATSILRQRNIGQSSQPDQNRQAIRAGISH
jgi:hypothetical protein